MLQKTEDEIENLQSRNQAKLETRHKTKANKTKKQHNTEINESNMVSDLERIEGNKPISCYMYLIDVILI